MSLTLTHYWDCNGFGCDSTTLQPWNESALERVCCVRGD